MLSNGVRSTSSKAGPPRPPWGQASSIEQNNETVKKVGISTKGGPLYQKANNAICARPPSLPQRPMYDEDEIEDLMNQIAYPKTDTTSQKDAPKGGNQTVSDIPVRNNIDADSSLRALDDVGAVLHEIGKEHSREVKELCMENEQLRQKLSSVLCATWNFQQESWHPSPAKPKFGNLRLLCSTEDPGVEKLAYEVDEEQQECMAALDAAVQFQPRSGWRQEREDMLQSVNTQRTRSASKETAKTATTSVDLSARPGFMLSPFSPYRLLWDVAGMFLLIYDMIFVPLGAFDPEEDWFTTGMDWVTLVFWSLDVGASFCTGYLDGGELVLDPRRVAKRYLGGSFLVDVVVVAPDWFFTIHKLTASGGEAKGDNLSKLVRAFRIVRIVRLRRVKKLKEIWFLIQDRIKSDSVFLAATIGKIIIVLLTVGHFMASAWYYVGMLGLEQGLSNWITEYDMSVNDPIAYRYFSSLHWTLSNCAFGSTDIEPRNSVERVVGVSMLLFGIVMNFLSAAMVIADFLELKAMGGDARKEIWMLRRYLGQQNVPSGLSCRILLYAESHCKRELEQVPAGKVGVLGLLSEQLNCELRCVTSYGLLFQHPLLQQCQEKPHILKALVSTVLDRKTFVAEELIFASGGQATHMYLVVSGEFEYHRTGTTRTTLHEGDSFCESSLWVGWVHRGTANGTMDSDVILVGCHTFGQVIEKDPQLWKIVSVYAASFVDWLNDQDPHKLSDCLLAGASATRGPKMAKASQSDLVA